MNSGTGFALTQLFLYSIQTVLFSMTKFNIISIEYTGILICSFILSTASYFFGYYDGKKDE